MSLLAHYKMNDNSAVDAIVDDASGNGHHGTAARNTNLTYYANGKVNGAYDANGTTDIIDCNSDFIGTTALTILAWIYLDSWGGAGFGMILDNAKTSFYVRSTTQGLQFTSNGSTVANSATGSLAWGAWYPVAVTRTAATPALTNFYINGILSGAANQSSGNPTAGTRPNVELGNRSSDFAVGFDGRMDDVRLYDEVLTVGQINRIVQAQHGTEDTLATLYAENNGVLRPVLRF